MPAYVDHVLHMSDSAFGYLMAAVGLGAMLGSVFVAATGGAGGKGMVLTVAVIANGALLVILGSLPHVAVVAIVLAGLGLCNAVTLAMCNTLLQMNIRDEYRGRVMSLYFLTFGLASFGSLGLGSIAEAAGLRVSLAGLGALVLALILLVTLRAPKVRQLR
jgi:predicted MFS family arabinose efflux permease